MNAQLTLTHMAHTTRRSAFGLDPRASRLFNRVFRSKKPNRVQQLLGNQARALNHISDVADEWQFSNRRFDGTRVIAVDTVHGTLNRREDFDYDFRPMQESDEDRWCRVASAMMNGVDLPPIEVVQVGEDYFVKDGHHRISVARALGYRYLDAVVEVWDAA